MTKGNEIFSGIAWEIEPYFAGDVFPRIARDYISWSEPGFQVRDCRSNRSDRYIPYSESYVSLLMLGGNLVMVIKNEELAIESTSEAKCLCAGVFPTQGSSVVERLPSPEGAVLLNGFYQIDAQSTSFYHIILN